MPHGEKDAENGATKKEEEELLAVRGVPVFIIFIATCKGLKPLRLSKSPVLESLCRRQVELYISSDLSVQAKSACVSSLRGKQ